MKRTPGIIVALPSSLHSAILASICSRTSDLISPVSPANRARKPCFTKALNAISLEQVEGLSWMVNHILRGLAKKGHLKLLLPSRLLFCQARTQFWGCKIESRYTSDCLYMKNGARCPHYTLHNRKPKLYVLMRQPDYYFARECPQ